MLSDLIRSIRSYSAVITDTPVVCTFKSFRTEKMPLIYYSFLQKIGTILTHVVLTWW